MTNLNESSCDLKEPVWLSNSATIEDRNLLPVSAVRYGPHKYELYKANITVGSLQCQPETEEDRYDVKNEVDDLKEKVNEIVLNMEENNGTDQDLIERIGNLEEIVYFECPLGPYYKTFGTDPTCYYFEAAKKNFADAQNNCATKFGIIGGHLAEPQTAERSVELNAYAQKTLNNQNFYWIGYDDLGHGQGNFRYSSSDTLSSISGKNYNTIDGTDGVSGASLGFEPSQAKFRIALKCN